ncbi:hypothetical protein MIND_00393800 [Mycena indigotica]|uniref:F-box domain-containing protein n=1 Tax=Mycena indigotica TaxID=2126181 RepID=A0A8H6W9Z1_9AGAR|nr:uncharacterized protein MIND_00393800 [Mycena indigotica]KAF7310202.1 hypothetical protein MIND_00393800 [Mycena indigotica]
MPSSLKVFLMLFVLGLFAFLLVKWRSDTAGLRQYSPSPHRLWETSSPTSPDIDHVSSINYPTRKAQASDPGGPAQAQCHLNKARSKARINNARAGPRADEHRIEKAASAMLASKRSMPSSFELLPSEIIERIAEHTKDDLEHGSTLALTKTCRRLHDITVRTLYHSIYIDTCDASECGILYTLIDNPHYASLVRTIEFGPWTTWGPVANDPRIYLPGLVCDALESMPLLQSIIRPHGCAEPILAMPSLVFTHLRSITLRSLTPDTVTFVAKHAPQLRALTVNSGPALPLLVDAPALHILEGNCLVVAVVCPAAPLLTHLQIKHQEEDDPSVSSMLATVGIHMPTLRLMKIVSWCISGDASLMDSIARFSPNLVSLALSLEADWVGRGGPEGRDCKPEILISTIEKALPHLPHLFHFEISQQLGLYAFRLGGEVLSECNYLVQLDVEEAWVRRWGAASSTISVCTLPAARWWRLSRDLWVPVTITVPVGRVDFMDRVGLSHLSAWTRRRTAADSSDIASASMHRRKEIREGTSIFARRLAELVALNEEIAQDFDVRLVV